MIAKRALLSVWMCSSILASAGQAHAQEGDYRYGQLLVQRSQSTWQKEEPAAPPPAPATYAPAPQVIPRYAPAPTPQAMTTPPPSVPAQSAPVAKEPPKKPINNNNAATLPASPMLGAYYMPAPPASTEEPQLAPGESLPAHRTPMSTASYTATPSPALESQPLVPEHIASKDTRTFMYRLPSGALASSDGAYIGGVPGPEHPGDMRETDVGPGFQGPVAADPGYLPSWFKVYASNGYRRNRVEFERTQFAPNGQQSALKEDWKSMGMYQVKGGADFTNRSGFLDGLYFEGSGSYGWTFSGDEETELTTYALTPDTDPTVELRSAEADEGDAYAWSAAVGYEFSPDFIVRKKAHTAVVPMIGYRFEQLNMTSTSGGGNSLRIIDYTTEWDGPFIGLKIGIEWPNQHFAFKTTYAYGNYDGSASTTNPGDPLSDILLTEESDASGLTFSGNYAVVIYEGLEAFIAADLEFWSASSDTTQAVGINNGQVGTANLDDVSWKSQFYQLGLSYRW